jgi:hypothetical protein
LSYFPLPCKATALALLVNKALLYLLTTGLVNKKICRSTSKASLQLALLAKAPCFVIKTSFLVAKKPIKKLCFFIDKPRCFAYISTLLKYKQTAVRQNYVLSNKG